MFSNTELSARFFQKVTARPLLALLISVAVIAATSAGLGRLAKDTSVTAFIPADHPAILSEEHAAEIFGLTDSIAIAIVTRDGSSIFTPSAFDLVAKLSDKVAVLPNIRTDRVTSLATESSISGQDSEVDVIPYMDEENASLVQVSNARDRWRSMPPHIGSIVSEDETGAIILAELVDLEFADQTYHSVLSLIEGEGVFP